LVLISCSLLAQTGVGSLSGQVLDPGGSVVPGAAVNLRNDATGVEAHTITSDAGVYSFPTLDIGTYSLSVEAKGFKRSTRPNVVVQAANRTAVEMRLEVGDVTQSVEVSAEAPMLSTETSDLGTNFQSKFMKDLPLFVGSGFRNP
jgi:hypothetical protein